mmetsp:Transcript_43133/g.69398  ORF Transcript_43133/g.69398 Transcript_43133/m.69398 type:complete len:208 (+) Transcript_43133:241-864(+)
MEIGTYGLGSACCAKAPMDSVNSANTISEMSSSICDAAKMRRHCTTDRMDSSALLISMRYSSRLMLTSFSRPPLKSAAAKCVKIARSAAWCRANTSLTWGAESNARNSSLLLWHAFGMITSYIIASNREVSVPSVPRCCAIRTKASMNSPGLRVLSKSLVTPSSSRLSTLTRIKRMSMRCGVRRLVTSLQSRTMAQNPWVDICAPPL